MPEDRFTTRMEVEGAKEAQKDIHGVSRAEGELADETRKAGDQAEHSQRKTEGLRGKLDGLKQSVGGMVQGWMGFTAIAATVVAGFVKIASAAQEALKEVVKLGRELKGLATALGGKRADQVLGDINTIAEEENLGVEGRNQLIQSVTKVAQAEPTLNQEQLRNRAQTLGRFSRATGVGGEEAFNLIQSIRTSQKTDFRRSADLATAFTTAGFESGLLQDIAQEGANSGLSGKRTLSLLYAARGKLNLVDSLAENITTFAEQLDERDESGALVQKLRDLGLSSDQDFVGKIRTLRDSIRSGKMTRSQLMGVTGGVETARVFDALAPAVDRVGQAQQKLAGYTMGGAIERAGQSQYVQAAARQKDRELRVQRSKEGFGSEGGAAVAEFISEVETDLAEIGGGDPWIGAALAQSPAYWAYRWAAGDGDEGQAAEGGAGGPDAGGAGRPQVIYQDNRTTINNAQQNINGRPPENVYPGGGRSDK